MEETGNELITRKYSRRSDKVTRKDGGYFRLLAKSLEKVTFELRLEGKGAARQNLETASSELRNNKYKGPRAKKGWYDRKSIISKREPHGNEIREVGGGESKSGLELVTYCHIWQGI